MIYAGNKEIKELYIGGTKIGEVWLGNSLVWTSNRIYARICGIGESDITVEQLLSIAAVASAIKNANGYSNSILTAYTLDGLIANDILTINSETNALSSTSILVKGQLVDSTYEIAYSMVSDSVILKGTYDISVNDTAKAVASNVETANVEGRLNYIDHESIISSSSGLVSVRDYGMSNYSNLIDINSFTELELVTIGNCSSSILIRSSDGATLEIDSSGSLILSGSITSSQIGDESSDSNGIGESNAVLYLKDANWEYPEEGSDYILITQVYGSTEWIQVWRYSNVVIQSKIIQTGIGFNPETDCIKINTDLKSFRSQEHTTVSVFSIGLDISNWNGSNIHVYYMNVGQTGNPIIRVQTVASTPWSVADDFEITDQTDVEIIIQEGHITVNGINCTNNNDIYDWWSPGASCWNDFNTYANSIQIGCAETVPDYGVLDNIELLRNDNDTLEVM